MASGHHPNGQPNFAGPAAPRPSLPAAWNPAALLNPRQHAVPKPRSPQPNRPVNGHSDIGLVFQFDNINYGSNGLDMPTPSASWHAQPAEASNVPNGVGSFLDRVNNLQDRSAAPEAKRRKVDSPDPSMVRSMGASGTGMLGQYVKEKQEESRKNTPAVQTVDLTDGNDDAAPKIDPEEEEVCYGKIQGRLECFKVPYPKPGVTSTFGAGYFPIIKIMLKRLAGDRSTRIQAYDHTREIVGNVDAATAAALAPVLDSPLRVRTECRIPGGTRTNGEVPGQETSRAYPLDITIYGPEKANRNVGLHLRHYRLLLSAPSILERGVRLVNPHNDPGLKPPPAPRPPTDAYSYRSTTTTRTVEEMRAQMTDIFDSVGKADSLPGLDPDPSVMTPLLKHQKQGLFFMTMREKPRELQDERVMPSSIWRISRGLAGEKIYHNKVTSEDLAQPPPETLGGILADMMGLGKTLSILSLIVNSFREGRAWAERQPQQPQAPPPNKNKHELAMKAQPAFGLTKLKRNAKTTLLVCPLSTITNWEEQIRQHLAPGTINYHIYHGPNRIKDALRLADFDLVITTYGSVSSELSLRLKRKPGEYPLEQLGWFRIVLDEAHIIRDNNTLQFKAICRLQACRRWAVTGTPVQNRLDDLGALLAFLRLKPFDDRGKFLRYLVEPFKNCDPEIVPKLRLLVDSVTLRRLKDKLDLPPRHDHVVKLDFTPEEREIYDLFARSAQDKVKVLTGPALDKLGGHTYIHILKAILRLRLVCAHGKDLLNEQDLLALQGMTADMAINIEDDDEEDKPDISEVHAYEMFKILQDANGEVCVVCEESLGAMDAANIESEGQEDVLGYMTPCLHMVCKSCIKGFRLQAKANLGRGQSMGKCPQCDAIVKPSYVEIRRSRADAEREGLTSNRSKKNTTEYSGPHTKTRALVEDLLKSEAMSAANPSEPPYKSVVFSGWTSHLDLIQRALDDANITYTRLDGSMSRNARSQAMDAFRDDPSVHVILVSIMAGGLGLNLTAASNVYVMEPQYNPQAEAQAVDRIHRLGQKRPVYTVRYIMKDSFEEKMVELQDKKRALASLSVGDGRDRVVHRGEAAKQKLMDLRSLFR